MTVTSEEKTECNTENTGYSPQQRPNEQARLGKLLYHSVLFACWTLWNQHTRELISAQNT